MINPPKDLKVYVFKSLRHIYDWYRNNQESIKNKIINPLKLDDFLRFCFDNKIFAAELYRYDQNVNHKFNKERLIKLF